MPIPPPPPVWQMPSREEKIKRLHKSIPIFKNHFTKTGKVPFVKQLTPQERAQLSKWNVEPLIARDCFQDGRDSTFSARFNKACSVD